MFLKLSPDFTNLSSLSCGNLLAKSCTLLTILYIALGWFNTRWKRLNPPNFIILVSWVFDNFMLADESFAKVLQILETYVSVNNNLYGKLEMKDLKLFQYHFLILILNYTILHLKCYI